MDLYKKNKPQLIEEIGQLKSRIRELELSISVYQEECVRRVEILESSREYIQAIIDNMGDPILVIDPDYHVVFANKKVKELAGGIDPVADGLFCYQVSHHRDKPCKGKSDPCPLKKFAKKHSPVVLTHTHYDHSGNKMIVEINATPILDKDGHMVHMIEACRDITQRTKMQEALRESEEQFRLLFENATDAIFWADAKTGVILKCNKAAEILLGRKHSEIVGQPNTILHPPEKAEYYAKMFKKHIEQKGSADEEAEIISQSGEIKPVHITSSLTLVGEKPILQGIFRDITERKQMENELRESETRYRSLFEQSSDAIFILEAKGPDAGRILSANKSACNMHGYSQKEMLKFLITELDTPEATAMAFGRIKRILKGETVRFEAMHRKKDGAVFPVEVSAGLMKIGGKELILAIERNISKRKIAEEDRNNLINELKHISKTDGLTGLLNRQHMDKRLTEEIHRAQRYENPLTLLMFDIDNFKKINDAYGHITGDQILKKAADVLKETLRGTDIAGRFGGDEFVLILVQTNMKVALQVAKRIIAKIEQAQVPFKKDQTINFTISIGLCQYNSRFKNIDEFIMKTDTAMYMAKSSGHNKICEAAD